MQGHFVVTGHFVTIHEFLVVPSLSHQVFSFHFFFTSSGKKPDEPDNSDMKDNKYPGGTLAVEIFL